MTDRCPHCTSDFTFTYTKEHGFKMGDVPLSVMVPCLKCSSCGEESINRGLLISLIETRIIEFMSKGR